MLGLVFTELVELVEERFSAQMADAILQDVAPANGGAYTAVGYYDHGELVSLVLALSRRTGVPVDTLVEVFGEHLLGRFAQAFPDAFSRCKDLFEFLASIDGQIHVEVRKLYPQAHLPRFEVLERSGHHMVLRYSSPRQMVPLALGLIKGAAQHYGQPCEVTAAPDGQAQASRLHVALVPA